MAEGLRFNQGKIRYDLLEPHAIEELAKVFTIGAEKYAPRNWEKGMPWSKVVASLKRHIAEFEKGEDYDKETQLFHMAHAAWNAMALVSYYKLAPQHDDRPSKLRKHVRIGLDIDDVLADWVGPWMKLHPDIAQAKKDSEDSPLSSERPYSWNFDRHISERFDRLKEANKLDDFYLNLPVLTSPKDIPFEPAVYVTSRPVDSKITEQWLDKHGFPVAQVITVGLNGSKLAALKEQKIDFFIDDSYKNYMELNNGGVCTYLFDAAHNKKYEVGFKRIKNLGEVMF